VSGDIVLDTSVVIAALRGLPGIETRLDQAGQANGVSP
jgi:predicted nucleic acid-binding protein